MKLPEYVTKAEVQRVCRALGLRDWTKIKEPKVTLNEAKRILREIDARGMKIEPEQFRAGLEVELEHGTMYKEANVTNNHPVITGMIVLAHMKESLDYYRRLEVAELEGDLHKSIVSGNSAKAKNYYKRITKARTELAKAEGRKL
ncbi:MAG: DUF5661 family protein [Thermodesulfovibrionales bacterium]|nr:DUF5661 family protein [Thermodesulfovibrionales bacterium]MDP3111144.1 DUF5661 family protein [Thermodesulfovibrionales bacterium]